MKNNKTITISLWEYEQLIYSIMKLGAIINETDKKKKKLDDWKRNVLKKSAKRAYLSAKKMFNKLEELNKKI